ncbi:MULTISPECIES: hypothetical protein [Rufibacter]|uniref:Uncharacterized protein n=1 Tax=Rufibacter quisquiliarum TaxID=1549639 RepID=A0A839GS49_9BACT|nr:MULTISPECIES: hypothetical protein [Rufibacter]MBA9077697.1 hypothetical protein [Rufibacter quisquiliarum]
MRSLLRYFTFALGLLLLLALAPEVHAQKIKSSKARKEIGRKGPGGYKKGEAPDANADRKMLLDRQKAIAQAKTSGGAGPRYSLAPNKYDTGKGSFSMGDYKHKTKGKKPRKQKKSKKLIDQENPNGKLYREGLKKRDKKFLFF